MSSDRRTHIAKEILSTERTFAKNLRTIVDVFLIPLRLAIEDGKPIIKQRALEQIFSNIEEIMRVSVQFLFLIEQRVEIWNDNQCIGDVFMEVIPEFNVYDKYLMDHHRAIMKVTELEKRGPFAQFLITALQRPECENLDVLALLITPVQRILRYKLFLEDLIKHTPENHTDYKNINTALVAVLEKAAAVNESIKTAENYEKLCQIQKSFITQSGNVKNLVEEDRLFIREGSLTKVCRKIPKKRWFFLFSDIFIYASLVTSGGGNLYSFHRMFQINKTKVKAIADTDTQKNAFQIITNDKSFTVFADSPEEKELWLQDFTKATSSKKTDVKEDAAAPVWVPDNNGVVCQLCSSAFTWVNRRHHCRQCGNLVCGACSTGRAILAHTADTKPVRVCDECSPPPVTAAPTTTPSGLAISAPTFNYGSSEHSVVSQIMKDTAASLTRTPSRSGIKPPSNPLPLTPIQMAAQTPVSTSPTSPNTPTSPTAAKSTKILPPVPAASLKRANTVGDSGPPLPPKPSGRTGPLPPPPTGPAPVPIVEEQPSKPLTPRSSQEPQSVVVEEQSLEVEVQLLLNNLQKMLKTEAQTSNMPLLERVRFFSNKINEHNIKYNTPPSAPPPSPLHSQPNTTLKPKAVVGANGTPSRESVQSRENVRSQIMRMQHASANDVTEIPAATTQAAPARPSSTPSNPPTQNGHLSKPPATVKIPNGAQALPVVPPRKAGATLRKISPSRASVNAPILVDSTQS